MKKVIRDAANIIVDDCEYNIDCDKFLMYQGVKVQRVYQLEMYPTVWEMEQLRAGLRRDYYQRKAEQAHRRIHAQKRVCSQEDCEWESEEGEAEDKEEAKEEGEVKIEEQIAAMRVNQE